MLNVLFNCVCVIHDLFFYAQDLKTKSNRTPRKQNTSPKDVFNHVPKLRDQQDAQVMVL